jgi:hypothetical protein
MPKSTALPEPWRDKLAAFCRKIGYRYVFRQANLQSPAPARGSFRFQCWIENVGAAPIYRDYTFALRLRQGEREAIVPVPDVDIRTRLPGDVWLDRAVPLPEGFRAGWVQVAAGLIDPESRQPRIRFANKETFADLWLDLGGLELS